MAHFLLKTNATTITETTQFQYTPLIDGIDAGGNPVQIQGILQNISLSDLNVKMNILNNQLSMIQKQVLIANELKNTITGILTPVNPVLP